MSYVDHDVNLWDELLWITGGLLEKLKTPYSLMVWDFVLFLHRTGCPDTITDAGQTGQRTEH
eukprot:12895835-Ditylum_brightwellii.AAC.1